MKLLRTLIEPSLATMLLGLAPFALHAQGAAATLRVEMRPSASVPQSQVALGEIAYLNSTDLHLLRRAVVLPVGMAPRAGGSTVLDQERLAAWITTRLGISPERIQWEGTGTTVVQSAAREMAGEALVAVAEPALRSYLSAVARGKGLEEARVEVTPVSLPTTISVPAGEAEFRVRPLSAVAPGKRMLVWIDVFAGQRHVKAVPVRFEVSVYAQAPVAARWLRSGEAIGAQDTVREQTDVAHLLGHNGPEPFLSSHAAQTTQAQPQTRTAVKAGEVLTSERVRPASAVSRGDRVTLIAQSGLVSLESKVEVLQAGEIGQVVRVRASNGTAPVMAKVVAPGQLELQQ